MIYVDEQYTFILLLNVIHLIIFITFIHFFSTLSFTCSIKDVIQINNITVISIKHTNSPRLAVLEMIDL